MCTQGCMVISCTPGGRWTFSTRWWVALLLPDPLDEGELPHQCVILALGMGVTEILPDDCRTLCRDGLTTRDEQSVFLRNYLSVGNSEKQATVPVLIRYVVLQYCTVLYSWHGDGFGTMDECHRSAPSRIRCQVTQMPHPPQGCACQPHQ